MNRDFNTDNKVKIFASYYRPHMKLFALDMICALAVAGADLAFPIVSRYALSDLLPQNSYRSFFMIVFMMVGVYIVRAFLHFVVSYWGHMLGVRLEADMRRDVFAHLQKLSFSFYDKTRTGQLMSRVVNDLLEIAELSHHGPEDLFISLVTLLGAFFALITVQWKLALVLFAVLPIMIAFAARRRGGMERASDAVKESTAAINSDLESSLSGIRVAKAFANEDYEIEKFAKGNALYRSAKNAFYWTMGVFSSGFDFMNSMLYVIVIGVGGLLIMRGEMQAIELVTFNLFINAFLSPIRKLAAFMEQYESGMAGFSRFVELMGTQPDIADAPGAVELKDVKGDIEFKNVSFSYDSGENVLTNVNLKIAPGSTLALVGPSGGGKSTLCQLIPRFYEIDSGSITVDGVDIKNIQMASLREHIGIVQQDVYLFAGTIKENIMYGDISAAHEQVVEAAKKAEIHDFIMNLPDGYDTYVGERGVLLSGGQKQRIAIARIFLKNPPMLILDEATSALDTQTERRIQQSLDELSIGRTTLVIAHRLSTIENADEIAVIGDEGIIEHGNHGELLARNGEYAALYYAQHSEEYAMRISV